MTLNELGAFISSYGFPIVACAALFWQIQNMDKKHSEETDKLSEAINNNTQAMITVAERMNQLEFSISNVSSNSK